MVDAFLSTVEVSAASSSWSIGKKGFLDCGGFGSVSRDSLQAVVWGSKVTNYVPAQVWWWVRLPELLEGRVAGVAGLNWCRLLLELNNEDRCSLSRALLQLFKSQEAAVYSSWFPLQRQSACIFSQLCWPLVYNVRAYFGSYCRAVSWKLCFGSVDYFQLKSGLACTKVTWHESGSHRIAQGLFLFGYADVYFLCFPRLISK